MSEKKQKPYLSPDLSKMQEIIVNLRTRIYIARDADPVEAKRRYLLRVGTKLP